MSNTQTHDILEAFAKANEAYVKVPQLEGEINSLNNTIKLNDTIIANRTEQVHTLEETIVKLRAEITALREERDNASFRELETAEKSDGYRKLLEGIMGLAKEAVTPEPEPVKVEPEVEQPGVDPVPEASQPYDGYTYGKFIGYHHWERPSNVTEERFIELGGQPKPQLAAYIQR